MKRTLRQKAERWSTNHQVSKELSAGWIVGIFEFPPLDEHVEAYEAGYRAGFRAAKQSKD